MVTIKFRLLLAGVVLLVTACGGGGGGDGGGATEMPPPSGPGWTKLADLPTPLARHAVAAMDGKIYAAGGYDRKRDFYIYDIAGNSWERGPNLPLGTDNVAAVAKNGKVYVFGGEAAQQLQIYDVASKTWSAGPGLPSVRFASIVIELAGRVHQIGGWNYSNTASASLATHEVFDLATGQHLPIMLAPLMQARNCAVAGVIDGRLYVAGGRAPGIRNNDATALSSVEVYSPVADGWDVRNALPTARACAAGAVLANQLYVLGGELPAPQIHKKIERLDPVTGNWQALTDMPYYVSAAGAVAVGDDIYVIGGYVNTVATMPATASRYVYKYRPTP